MCQDDAQAQASIADYAQFSKMMKLVAFQRFDSAEEALEECNSIANGEASSLLKNFLELNLPSTKKILRY